MSQFKLVTINNFHEMVPNYISENKIIISEYSDMTDVILKMIRVKYFFNFDKNILRGFLEDLTFIYSPDDDLNKDRIINMLESSEDEDSDEECHDSGFSIHKEGIEDIGNVEDIE
tara:strand:- start:8 stop:352 length:345 start_codon:yes stop_codon:yes gene_type:complete